MKIDRLFVVSLGAITGLASCSSGQEEEAQRPNILILLADDETHIRELLEKYDLAPKGGASLAAAAVRGLILTVSHKTQIGALYPQVLETLVHGACRELFE